MQRSYLHPERLSYKGGTTERNRYIKSALSKIKSYLMTDIPLAIRISMWSGIRINEPIEQSLSHIDPL